jgi:hypothetical protein
LEIGGASVGGEVEIGRERVAFGVVGVYTVAGNVKTSSSVITAERSVLLSLTLSVSVKPRTSLDLEARTFTVGTRLGVGVGGKGLLGASVRSV